MKTVLPSEVQDVLNVNNCSEEDLKNPEIRARLIVFLSKEIQDMMAICESFFVGDDIRALLERAMEPLQKAFDFIVNYQVRQE